MILTPPEIETRLETDIAAMENMQEARRANWLAEEAKIETKMAARRTAWHVEESGRHAKIAALKSKLSIKRDARLAEEVKKADAAARSAAFVAKTEAEVAAYRTSLVPPPLIRAPTVYTAPPPLMLPPLPK